MMQANEQHLLQQLLPPLPVINVLRSRRHNYTLSIKTDYDDRYSFAIQGHILTVFRYFSCI